MAETKILKFSINVSGTTYYSDGEKFYTDQNLTTEATLNGLNFDGKTVKAGSQILSTGGNSSISITDYGYGYELGIGDDVTLYSLSNATWEYEFGELNAAGGTAGYYIASDGSIQYDGNTTVSFSSFTGLKLSDTVTIDKDNWKNYFNFNDGKAITITDTSFLSLNGNALSIDGTNTDEFYFKFADNASDVASPTEAHWSSSGDIYTFYSESHAAGYIVENNGKSITNASATTSTSLFSISGLSNASITDGAISGIAIRSDNYWVTISDSSLVDTSKNSSIVLTDTNSGDLRDYTLKVDGAVKAWTATNNSVAGGWSATTSTGGGSTYTYTSAYVSAPYAALEDNTLAYYIETQAQTFDINGLIENIPITNKDISNAYLTIDQDDDSKVFNITLMGNAVGNSNVIVTNTGNYSVKFTLDQDSFNQNNKHIISDDDITAHATTLTSDSGLKLKSAQMATGYLAADDKVLYYANALSSATFTITGLSDGLTNFNFSDAGVITAELNNDTVEVGTVESVVDGGKTTYNISLTSDAIDTTQSDFSGINISSDEKIYFTLAMTGQSVWDSAQSAEFTTLSSDSYTYTAGYSAGFTKRTDTVGELNYSFSSTAGSDNFTIGGVANNLYTPDYYYGSYHVLDYVEISSWEQFETYFMTGDYGPKSAHYKITKSFAFEDTVPIFGNNVVIDLAKDVQITAADGVDRLFHVGAGSLTITGEEGSSLTNSNENGSGVILYPAWNSGWYTRLTVDGEVTIDGTDFGIGYKSLDGTAPNSQSSGSTDTVDGTEIVINGGTIKGSTAIYQPQAGTLVINDGTISGTNAGVEIRSGNLYVNGGTITASETNYSVTSNTDGTTTTGAAVAVAQQGTNNISVNITGGTIGDGSDKVALSVDNPNGDSDSVDINITNGTLNGKVVNGYENVALNIAGGSISGDLSSTITSGEEIFDIYTDDKGNNLATISGDTSLSGVSNVAKNAPEIPVPQLNSAGAIVVGKENVEINSTALKGTAFTFTGKGRYKNFLLGNDVATSPSLSIAGHFNDYSVYGGTNSAVYTTNLYSDYYATNSGGASHYTMAGGYDFQLNGISYIEGGFSLYDSGYLTANETTATTDGQFSITSYDFIVREKLLQALEQGHSLELVKASSNSFAGDYTFGFDTSDETIRQENTASSVSAAFNYDTLKSSFVYTGKIDKQDYFTQASHSITHVEQVGGQPFTLEGDIASSLSSANLTVDGNVIKSNGQSIGMVSVVGSSGYVYLSKDFFAGAGSTIKLSDTIDDSINYRLAEYTGDDETYLKIYGNGNMTDMDFSTVDTADKYQYTAPVRAGGMTLSTDSSLATNYVTNMTYSAGVDSAKTFTITGATSLASVSSTAILNCIEITSEEDLNKYITSDGLSSGYYKITANIALTKSVSINANVVIDVADSVTVSSDADTLFRVNENGNLTIQGEGTLNAATNSVVYLNSSSKLTVNGNVTLESNSSAISGSKDNSGTEIVINGGTISGSTAIYHPQDGTLVINDGTISGTNAGVEIRSGNLYINGGTITASETNYSVTSNTDGTTTKGAAVAVAQDSTNQNISVNIAGGTLNGTAALSVDNPDGSASVDVNVTNGTLNGKVVNGYEDVALNIAGGTITDGLSSTITSGNIFNVYTDDSGTSFANISGTIPTSGISNVAKNAPKFAKPQLNSAGAIVVNGQVVTINNAALSLLDFSGDKVVNLSSSNYSFALGNDVSQLDDNDKPSVYKVGGFSDVTTDTATYTTDFYSGFYSSTLTSGDTNTFAISEHDSTGGHQFIFGGLSGLSNVNTSIQDGYVSVTDNGSLSSNGDFTISGYSFTIRKGLVEGLKSGSSIYIDTAKNISLSVIFDANGFSDDLSNTDALYTGTTADNPTLSTDSDGSFTYTAELTRAHYEIKSAGIDDDASTADIDESNRMLISHAAQVGGESFNIAGLYNHGYSVGLTGNTIAAYGADNILGTADDIALAILGDKTAGDGGHSSVYVTLTANAFDTTNSATSGTVTLTDLDSNDSIDFLLYKDDTLPTTEQTYGASFSTLAVAAEDNRTRTAYIYSDSGTLGYYNYTDKTDGANDTFTTSLKHVYDQGGDSLFQINGFDPGLSLSISGGSLYAAEEGGAFVTVGTVDGDTLTLNTTNVILDGVANNSPATISVESFTDKIYSLSIAGSDFNLVDEPYEYEENTIVSAGGSTYTYYGAGFVPTYTTLVSDNTYIYQEADWNKTFSISGLRTDLTDYLSNIIGTLKDPDDEDSEEYTLKDFITFDEDTGIGLNSYDLLPTSGISAGDKITVTFNSKAKFDDDVTAEFFYVGNDIPHYNSLSQAKLDDEKEAASFDTAGGSILTTAVYKAIIGGSYGASLADDNTATLTFIRGEVGGASLVFNGFASLSVGDSDKIFDALNNPVIEIGNTSFDSDGNITGYTFNLTSKDAVDFSKFGTNGLSKLSITNTDNLNVTLNIVDNELFDGENIYATWSRHSNGRYVYTATGLGERFAEREDGDPTDSYSYIGASGQETFIISQSLSSGGNITSDAPFTVNSGGEAALAPYFKMTEDRATTEADTFGTLSAVTLAVGYSAFENYTDANWNKDFTIALNTDYTNVATKVVMSDSAAYSSANKLSSFEAAALSAVSSIFDGSYIYKADAHTKGFYEDDNKLKYTAKGTGGESFTISGMSSNLSVVTIAGGGYSIIKNAGTADSLIVGSISNVTVDNKIIGSVIITNETAFGLSAANTVAGGNSFTITLTDAQGDNVNYRLSLGEDFRTSKTAADYSATFGHSSGSSTFTYHAAGNSSYYLKNNTDDSITSFTYYAQSDDDTLKITNLNAALAENFTIDSKGVISAGGSVFGTLNGGKFTLNDLALPVIGNVANVIQFEGIHTTSGSPNYSLGLDNNSTRRRKSVGEKFIDDTTDKNKYTYNASGSTAGFGVSSNNQAILYYDTVGAQTFTIAGISTGLTITTLDSEFGGTIMSGSNSAIVISRTDDNATVGTVTLYRDALAGTSITLTNADDNYFKFSLAFAENFNPTVVGDNWTIQTDDTSGSNLAIYTGQWTTAGYTLNDDNSVANYSTIEGDSSAQIKLSGITDTVGFNVDDNTATLNAAGFSDAVQIQLNSLSRAFNLQGTLPTGNANKMFIGTTGADTITSNVDKLEINLGDGNDLLTNSGSSVIIGGGSGADTITNTGSFVSIDGGADNDIINLDGGNNATVNTSLGDDTINVGTDITNFAVSGFSTSDVIQFNSNISGLSMVDGKLVATAGNQTVTISGISSTYNVGGWSYATASSIGYQQTTVAGALSNGAQIIYDEENHIETLFTIDGLSTSDNLTLTDKVVIVGESALWARPEGVDTITIDNGYKLSFGTIASEVPEDGTISADGYYDISSFAGGTINVSATNVKLTGTNSNSVVVNVTATGANFWIKDLTLGNGRIAFTGGENTLTVKGSNSLTCNGGNAVINVGTGTLNITSAGNKADKDILTVSNSNNGAGIGGNVSEDLSSSTINIGGYVTINATSDGAGIGSGQGGKVGTITIGGYAQVTATANGNGAGIGSGGGEGSSVTTINIGGNAKVNATVNGTGAGIGSGYNRSKVGTINIGGNANVTATIEDSEYSGSGAGIGSGYEESTVDTINIGGNATVNANAIEGAGIGSGQFSAVVTINIGGNAKVNAKAEDGYTSSGAGIGSGLQGTAGTINISSTNQVTGSSEDSAGISADAITVKDASKVGGLTGTAGTDYQVNENLTTDADSLNTEADSLNITTTDEPGGNSDPVIYGTLGGAGWHETLTTHAMFNLAGLSDYFTLESASSIVYHEEELGDVQVELSGVSNITSLEDPTTNSVVTLAANNFAGGVSVIQNAGNSYAFYLSSGDYSGYSFYGLSTAADTVTVAGNKLALNVGGGSNVVYGLNTSASLTITAGDDANTIYAGSSNHITVGSGADYVSLGYANTIDAGDGDNTIFAAGANHITTGSNADYISLNSGNYIDAGDGTNTIFAGSSNNITTGSGADYISLDSANNIDAGEGANTIFAGNANHITAGSSADYISLSGSGNYIDAGEGANTIYGANGNNITADSGADYISLNGSSNNIDAGDGNNTVSSTGNYNRITTGSGADYISLSGTGNSIDAGTGADFIAINGTNAITLGTDNDSDTISVAAGVTSFTVSGFSASDMIDFGNTVTNIASIDGGLVATVTNSTSPVTVYGVDFGDTLNGWHLNDTNAIYRSETLAGGYSEGNTIQYRGQSFGSTLIEIAGISTIDGIDISNNFVTLSSDNILDGGATVVTNNLDYGFSIVGGNGGKSFTGTSSADTIDNSASNMTIYGLDGNDYIGNIGANALIDGGAGNDTISNNRSKVSISGGAGNDSIDNSASNVTIDAGDGNDTITNNGSNVSINAGGGSDYIYNYNFSNVTMLGGAGNDSIYNIEGGASALIDAGDGDNEIFNTGNFATILGGSGADYIQNAGNSASNVTIDGGLGDDEIFNSGSNVSINAGGGSDYIYNQNASNVTMLGGAGNDSIYNIEGGASALIDAGNGDNEIFNTGNFATILGGSGADYIQNAGNSATITTGDGYDTIFALGNIQFTVTDFNNTLDKIKLADDTATVAATNISALGESSIVVSGESVAVTIDGVNVATVGTLWNFDDTLKVANLAPTTLAGASINENGEVVWLNESISAAVLSISGVNNITGFLANVDDKSATLNATSFTNAVTVTNNSGSYALNLMGSVNEVKTFTGLDTADTITNAVRYIAINALGGDNLITNNKSNNVTITAGDGADTITSTGNNVSISGGSGANVINITSGNYATVNVLGGNDLVSIGSKNQNGNIYLGAGDNTVLATNGIDSNIITALGGNDLISLGSNCDKTTINAGDGANTIYAGSSNYITTGGGNDYISVDHGNHITTGGGNDYVSVTYSNYIDAGDGTNTIYAGSSNRITTGSGADYISLSGTGNYIDAGDGANTIYAGSSNRITTGSGADYISVSGTGNYINAGDGTNTIYAGSSNRITTGNGADYISLSGTGNYIDAGTGADFIAISGNNAITLGTDNDSDTISVAAGVTSFTVSGFSASDVIDFGNTVTNISTIDGGLIATAGSQTVTVYGVDFSDTLNTWHMDGNSAIYSAETLAGGYSVGNTIQYREHSFGTTLIEINGISSTVSGIGISGTFATLSSDNILSTGATVVTNTVGYGFSIVEGNGGKSFTGTSGADTISNTVANMTIYGLDGNDIITNNGLSAVINGGGGSDIIQNYGDNSTLNGGDGNDNIWSFSGANTFINGGGGSDIIQNYGDNSTLNGGDGYDIIWSFSGANTFINGGGGSDMVVLFGGTDATVNMKQGADIIWVSDGSEITVDGDTTIENSFTGVSSFTVEGFGTDDEIQLLTAVDTLTAISGGISAGNIEILGISSSIYAVSNDWTVNSAASTVSYVQSTVAGAKLSDDGTTITYDNTSGSSTLFTIDGLSTENYLTLADTVVSVGESALWARAKDTITIDKGYAFSMSGTSSTIESISGTSYTISTDGVYKFAEGFTGTVTINATNVKLIGASSQLKDVFIDASAVSGINLWIENLNIIAETAVTNKNANYRIINFGGGNNSLTVKGDNTLINALNANTRYGTQTFNQQAIINTGTGTLNILGTGTLTARFTGQYSYGAAIGSDNGQTVGTINIGDSVTINATAKHGAAIGTGTYGSVSVINIGSNAKVNATATGLGAGIGAGNQGSFTAINIGGEATVTATAATNLHHSIMPIGGSIGGSVGTITVKDESKITASRHSTWTTKTDLSTAADSLTSTEPTSSSGIGSVSVIYGTLGGAGWYTVDGADNHAMFNLAGLSDYFTLESASSIVYHEEELGAVQVELSGVSNITSLEDPTTNSVVTLAADNFADNVAIVSNSAAYAFYLSSGNYNGYSFTGMSTADTINVQSGASSLAVNLGAGDDTIQLNGSDNYFTIDGGEGDDYINGLTFGHANRNNNASISGGAGNDSIIIYGAHLTLDGGNGNDLIWSTTGEHNSIVGGEGDDTLWNWGDNSTITAGIGNDSIWNTGDSAFLDGGNGSDTITNSGDNVLINGGSGANVINLNDGDFATINTSLGDDTISVASAVKNFSVSGFGVNDLIQLSTAVDTLTTINGGIAAGGLSIYGINLATVTETWTASGNSVIYSQGTISGAYLNGSTSISYIAGNDSAAQFTITGLGTSTGIEVDDKVVDKSTVVTLTAAALSGVENDVSISGGNYTFSLSGVNAPISGNSSWYDNDGIATYYDGAWTVAGFSLGANDTVVNYSAQSGIAAIELSGASNNLAVPVDNVLTITEDNFSGASVAVISHSGYSFSLSGTFTDKTFNGSKFDDTIISGTGNIEMSGGSGADMFVFGGGKDIITDYSFSENDKLSGFNIYSISNLSGTDDLVINFSDSSLQLNGISNADTVKVDDADWIFDSGDNEIFSGDRKAVILLDTDEMFDLTTIKGDKYSVVETVTALHGGTVNAGISGTTMIGYRNTSLSGNVANDDFVYAGGSMTIASYIFCEGDRISLTGGYYITDYSAPTDEQSTDKNVTLNVSNGTLSGTIILENIISDNPEVSAIDVYYGDNQTDVVYISGDRYNNTKNRALATDVTIYGSNRDFGVQTDLYDSGAPSGAEYYEYMTSITSTQDDATIVGSARANTFIINGSGSAHVLTGGLGKDTFIFKGNGGIITDFGIGAANDGSGNAFATSPTDTNPAYYRNNSTTYAEGNDVLKVNGSVVEIAFKNKGIAASKKSSVFSAYVTYDADKDTSTTDDQYTILLGNIVKKTTKTSDTSPVWQTDDVAAKSMLIYEDGTKLTGSKIKNLSTNTSVSSYLNDQIIALDNIVSKSDTGLAVVGMASDTSNSVTAACNGIEIVSSKEKSNQ